MNPPPFHGATDGNWVLFKVIDVNTGQVRFEGGGTKERLVDFAIRSDGYLIAFSGSRDSKWNHLVRTAVLRKFKIADGIVSNSPRIVFRSTKYFGTPHFAMSNDGMVAMTLDNLLLIIDTRLKKDQSHIATVDLPSVCRGLAISSDGKRIAAMLNPTQRGGRPSDNEHELVVIDTDTGTTIYEWDSQFIGGHSGVRLSWSPTGRYLVGTGGQGIFAWSWDTKEVLHEKTHLQEIDAVQELASGRRIVTASSDGTVGVWDVDSQERIAHIAVPEFAYDRPLIRSSADGELCAVRGSAQHASGMVRIVDLKQMIALSKEDAQDCAIMAGRNGPDSEPSSNSIVLADEEKVCVKNLAGDVLKVYDFCGESSILPNEQESGERRMTLSDNGRRVAVCVRDGLFCFDIDLGKSLGVISCDFNIYWFGFSPDATSLWVANAGASIIEVWT